MVFFLLFFLIKKILFVKTSFS